MPEIEIRDLKYGSGVPVRSGDTIELHYIVADSLTQLDVSEILQGSWRRGRPLIVTLGLGTLRPEIERALEGLPVGSDRRMSVPVGHWPDVDRATAISLVVQSIVRSADASDSTLMQFERLASNLPAEASDLEAGLKLGLIELLMNGMAPTGKSARRPELIRLRLEAPMLNYLRSIVGQSGVGHRLRYKVREVGELHKGSVEVEVSRQDAHAIVEHLKESTTGG